MAWPSKFSLLASPHQTESTFQPWDRTSEAAVTTLRTVVMDPEFWENLITYYAEETDEVSLTQDNVSTVKSICELLQLLRP